MMLLDAIRRRFTGARDARDRAVTRLLIRHGPAPSLVWPARYGLVLGLVVAATALTTALREAISSTLPTYILFYPIVALLAGALGLGAGIAATLLSALSAAHFFLAPSSSSGDLGAEDQIVSGVFIGAGVFVCLLLDWVRRAHTLASELIRQSEAELNEAQRVAGLGNWTLDLRTGDATWSDGMYRILGRDPSMPAVPGHQQEKLWTPESWAGLSAALETLTSSGEPCQLELEAVRADGTKPWVLVRGEAERGTNGSIVRLRGIALDITQRKEAERELRRASTHARSLIEVSLDPLVTISPSGAITDVNQATERATGMPRARLVGSDFASYFTDPSLARAGYERVLEEGAVRDYPLTLRGTPGQAVDVLYNASVYRDEAGAVLGVFAAARDVTERNKVEAARRRAELELRELNSDFVTLLENTSDFIYFKDKDSRFRFCSQTMAAVTGHRSWRDMIGKCDRDVFPADTARIYVDEEQPVFSEGRPLLNKTDLYYDAQGRQGWVNTNKWPVFGDDGTSVVGIVGISRDVTELKDAEDRINELNRDLERRVVERTGQLEAANRELEAFSYSVSHDLRAPLRAVQGFSRILVEEHLADLPAEAGRYLLLIGDNAKQMGQLIDDLLAFSRLNRQPSQADVVEMKALVEQALEGLDAERENRQVAVHVGALPTCLGDSALLRQVVLNLLSNAFKFTRRRDPATIEIGSAPELARPGEAVYFVKDNGVGFDMQYAGKLFGVFQRLHSAAEYEGTGVGLAIVQRIVHRHGGRVWADATVDRGATFFVALPQAKPS